MRAILVLVTVGVLVWGCSPEEVEPTRPPFPETASASAPSTAIPLPSGSPETENTEVVGRRPPRPADERSESAVVARVIDGDTFELTDKRKVRVLGIDSCEMSTPGGKYAKETAEFLLRPSNTVVLVPEPGVSGDQWGRMLRYVKRSPSLSDFGEAMIDGPHTGVYTGRNDASPEYVKKLRGLDVDGRNCANAGPTASSYIPTPGGEDDGESRFCRKRRWC